MVPRFLDLYGTALLFGCMGASSPVFAGRPLSAAVEASSHMTRKAAAATLHERYLIPAPVGSFHKLGSLLWVSSLSEPSYLGSIYSALSLRSERLSARLAVLPRS